jgi:hypothetical protein
LKRSADYALATAYFTKAVSRFKVQCSRRFGSKFKVQGGGSKFEAFSTSHVELLPTAYCALATAYLTNGSSRL